MRLWNKKSGSAPRAGRSRRHGQGIILAIEDEALRAEALHIAVATGRTVDDCDPRELRKRPRRAACLLVDSPALEIIEAERLERQRIPFFLLCGDLEGDPCSPSSAYRIPAQATDLLAVLGRLQPQIMHMPHVAIFGAVGGTGCSLFAAALALRAQTVGPIIIDASVGSGGLDLSLGIEETEGLRWADLRFDRGSLDPHELRAGLMKKGRVSLLSQGRGEISFLHEEDIAQALPLCVSTFPHEALIIDMGHVYHAQPEEVIKEIDHAVLLIPLELRAVAAGRQAISRLRSLGIEPLVVGVHRNWSGLDTAQAERALQATFAACYSFHPRIAKAAECSGLQASSFPSSLVKALDHIIAQTGLDGGAG